MQKKKKMFEIKMNIKIDFEKRDIFNQTLILFYLLNEMRQTYETNGL